MKNFNTVCRRFFPAVQLAAVLLLGGAGAFPSFAQTAAAPREAGTNDVSVFPGLDKLPGKPPPHVGNGLAGMWRRAHQQWQRTAASDVGAVVFLGDSITQGWNSLSNDFPNLHVANRGIGGDITSGVLYRLDADVLSLNPAAIVLLIGTNDAGDDAEAEDVANNTKLILQAIKKFNPNLKVVVCKIMPRGEVSPQGAPPPLAAKIQKINSLVEDYVKSEPQFAICDTWSAYADANGAASVLNFQDDLLHLNPTGYTVWKAALDPVLTRMHIAAPKP